MVPARDFGIILLRRGMIPSPFVSVDDGHRVGRPVVDAIEKGDHQPCFGIFKQFGMFRHESRCALRRPHEREQRDIRKLPVDFFYPLLAAATDLSGSLRKGMAEIWAIHERKFRQRIRFDVETDACEA